MSEIIKHNNGTNERSNYDRLMSDISSNSRGELDTWGAMPPDSFSYDLHLQKQRRDIYNWRAELIDKHRPSWMSDSLFKYVQFAFINQLNTIKMANYNNFCTRKNSDIDNLKPDERNMFDKMMQGGASPAELLYLRNILGIDGIELGCVTHPYGERIDYLTPMRESVNQAADIFDGKDINKTRYKVVNTDVILHPANEQISEAYYMTRVKDIAQIFDDTIIRERSSFIVRVDKESNFNQSLAERIRNVDLHDKNNFIKRKRKLTIFPVILEHTRAVKEVENSLNNNDFETVIPLLTAVYASNDGENKDDQEVINDQKRIIRAKKSLANESIKNI